MAFFRWLFSETAGFEGYRSRFRGIRGPKARLRPEGLEFALTPPYKRLTEPPGDPGPLEQPSLGRDARGSIPNFRQVTSPWRSKIGRPPVVAPAGKFPSRIRILQFSTPKITTTRETPRQFGETSYRFSVFVYRFEFAEPIWGSSPGPTRGSLTPPGRHFVVPPLYWPPSCRVYEETGPPGTRPPNPKR